ncbi:unnamed protein product [Knipowitschia caucasica]
MQTDPAPQRSHRGHQPVSQQRSSSEGRLSFPVSGHFKQVQRQSSADNKTRRQDSDRKGSEHIHTNMDAPTCKEALMKSRIFPSSYTVMLDLMV